MEVNKKVKNICGFYISNVHFSTMLLPYIKKQMEVGTNFINFLELDLTKIIKNTLSKIIMEENRKAEILKIKWNSSKEKKISEIERELKKIIEEDENEINVIISGGEKFIEEMKKNVNQVFSKNQFREYNKYIKIISCYEVEDFNENIKGILDESDYIINTSGVHQIEEIFEGYNKRIV